ncbi:DeoR family transcriptional regulator [Alteribacter natronophilus]|uniref:DeoR family transcriptional regulator n=1 Tax=Alteribacter natronophilus TaxID=2583810 RepID=UPI00110EB49E|nr:DeoR family transcriptional regulator [Alteribacter natronophilus]TMW70318.1 DeoR family transcriptional regulator [Alteribacter natronophilus]
MLPDQRKQQILAWLEEEQHIRVVDLSQRLGVSEMTVYRDIQRLEKDGRLERSSRGVSKKQTVINENALTCTFCHKPNAGRQQVQLIDRNGRVEHLCCAHCGILRFDDLQEEITQFICKDFLTDTTISAKMTFFLIGADSVMQCCSPQVIPFSSREQAEKFRSGFGGSLYSLEGAVKELTGQMTVDGCCGGKK